MNLQYEVQNVLAQAVQENEAKGGSIVVLDPHSGDVLAMANAPTFDANHYGDVPAADRVEPGDHRRLRARVREQGHHRGRRSGGGDIDLNET